MTYKRTFHIDCGLFQLGTCSTNELRNIVPILQTGADSIMTFIRGSFESKATREHEIALSQCT